MDNISSDDVEDDTINIDEVNESFYRGYRLEGNLYLEKVEKQMLASSITDDCEKIIIKAFDNLTRKLKRGDDIEVLPEFEKYGLNSEILSRLGTIAVDTAPRGSMKKVSGGVGGNASRHATEDRYADEIFEDYENDFEEYDDRDRRVLPKYADREPHNIRSKTAPAHSEGAIPPLKFSTVQPGRSGGRFKTSTWIHKGQWRLGEKIGSGAFGDVYQGMSDDGYLFACKQLKIVDQKEIVNLIGEIELMQTFDHPNIVKYLGAKVDIDKGAVYIFQEWVPGGSVAHLLKRFGPFSVGVVRTYTRQIILGLIYLHDHGVVHRDIKGGNILVDDSGVVKLADFGASTEMAFGETVETTTIKGTPYFMAPEVLGESRYGRRGDVWAVGCTIIQMLTGEPPWKDRKPSSLIHLHTLVSTWKGVPAVDREIPEDLQAFLELCFIKDFNFRPMAKSLFEHEFLNPLDDELGDSLGGTSSNLREQLERAAARASFQPDDTFGDIEAIIAQRGGGAAAARSAPSADHSGSGRTDSPSGSSSASPSRQSSSNPFARKSAVGSPAPSPLQVSPASAPVNPFAKSGAGASGSGSLVRSSAGRSSGLTISSAVEALSISPPSSASSAYGSARHGSDPAVAPPPTQSPATSKSNASTPRVFAERRATNNEPTRRGSESSEDGSGAAAPGRRPVGHRRPLHFASAAASASDDPDVTPRSHHGSNNRLAAMAASASATALPSAKFNFDGETSREGSSGSAGGSRKTPRPASSGAGEGGGSGGGGGEKWKCENPKCLKWNTGPDYCEFCAIRRGATGARGAAAKIHVG